MAVTVAKVLAPVGVVEKHLFPGEGDGQDDGALQARLEAYITEGRNIAVEKDFDDLDVGTIAWVYYRAFQAACDRLNALPSDVDQVDHGGHRYTSDQRRSICERALAYRLEFESLIPITVIVPVSDAQTRTVTTVTDW